MCNIRKASNMQTFASLRTITCILLILPPHALVAAKTVLSSRHVSGSAKPFLDGDFTRDSSNPLDVYEDLQITTPPPSGGTKGAAAKQSTAPAPAPAPAPAADAGKGNATSAVQVKKLATVRAGEASKAKPAASNATTAVAKKEEASSSNATAAKAVATKEATNASSTNKTEVAAVNASQANKTEDLRSDVTSCVTRNDPRAVSFWSQTAEEGSPCVFGVDPRDEGSHCIPETDFGSNGWCFTEKDQSAWGSCGTNCPLYGSHAKLASKIDGVANAVGKVILKVDQLAKKASPSE